MKKDRSVHVVGVGMTKFERCERAQHELVAEAITEALAMSGTPASDFEQAYCGYVRGMSAQGQRCGFRYEQSFSPGRQAAT